MLYYCGAIRGKGKDNNIARGCKHVLLGVIGTVANRTGNLVGYCFVVVSNVSQSQKECQRVLVIELGTVGWIWRLIRAVVGLGKARNWHR